MFNKPTSDPCRIIEGMKKLRGQGKRFLHKFMGSNPCLKRVGVGRKRGGGGGGDFEHTLAMMIKLTNLSEVTKRSVSSNFSKKN